MRLIELQLAPGATMQTGSLWINPQHVAYIKAVAHNPDAPVPATTHIYVLKAARAFEVIGTVDSVAAQLMGA